MLEGKTFLVTGATGRLGCETVLRLEELGATVLPLVLPGYPPKPKRIPWKARSEPLVVTTTEDLNRLMAPDYVINFHWRVDRSLSYTAQLLFEIDSNIHCLVPLWEWLVKKPVKRFVNISTLKVFSHLNENPVSAETEPRPLSPYGIAKLAAEHFFDAYFSEAGRPVVHLRLCSVASCGENPSHLMSRLYAGAFENQRIIVNKGHLCTILYIDDVVDLVIQAALAADSPRYLITTDPLKTEQVVAQFEGITHQKVQADFVDLEPGIADPAFESDIEELRTDWTRCTSLESLIKKFIHACSKNEVKTFCSHISIPKLFAGGT